MKLQVKIQSGQIPKLRAWNICELRLHVDINKNYKT